jgi:hypothetical protein
MWVSVLPQWGSNYNAPQNEATARIRIDNFIVESVAAPGGHIDSGGLHAFIAAEVTLAKSYHPIVQMEGVSQHNATRQSMIQQLLLSGRVDYIASVTQLDQEVSRVDAEEVEGWAKKVKGCVCSFEAKRSENIGASSLAESLAQSLNISENFA